MQRWRRLARIVYFTINVPAGQALPTASFQVADLPLLTLAIGRYGKKVQIAIWRRSTIDNSASN